MTAKIQVMGGQVTNQYTTLVSAMAVTLDAPSAALLRQSPRWRVSRRCTSIVL